MDANEKLRVCLLKLLNLSSLKLFGALVYKFDTNVIDGEHGTAFVGLDTNTKKPIMRFYSTFLDKLVVEEVLYVVIHEIMHILDNHCYRGLNVQYPGLFNIAADHVINDMLDTDANGSLVGKLKSPKDRVIINYFKGQNVSTEEVYAYLVENAKFETITFSSGSGDGDGDPQSDNSPNDQSTDESNQDDESTSDKSSSPESESDGTEGQTPSVPSAEGTITKIKVTMPDGQVIEHIIDVKLNTELSENDVKSISKQLQAEARSVMNSTTFKGDTSLKIAGHIEDIIKVEIPWDVMLENAIKTNVTLSAENKSWKSINKRMRSYDIVLPGNDIEEIADNLYIVIDSSGSISDRDLSKFADIIRQAMIHFKNLFIIKHDTEVYGGVICLTKDDTFSLTHDAFKIEKRGGTCHIAPFNILEEEYQEHDNMGLIILLTDFYSNIERIWNDYTFTHNVPMKIVLPEHSNTNIPDYIDKTPIIIKEANY